MKMSSEAEQEEWKDVPWLTSKRVQLAVLGFFGFINVYALRVNMSVAIVCMVNATAVNSNGDNTTNSQSDSSASSCGLLNSDLNQTSDEEFENGEFIWDKETQGYILGAFFWGYLVTQIPGGWVATKFGGKQVFGISMLLATLVTFITPIAAQTSYVFLIVLRVILGVCSGVTFPAMHALWGSWAPPMERSKLTAFTYAGAQLGNVITFPLSGMLCKYGFSGGWPSIFYILGMLNFVWVVLWSIFISNTPEEHKWITEKEKLYIQETLKETKHKELGKKVDVPWRSIVTSVPVYTIIIVNVLSDWGAYTLLINIPTYMKEVLKLDIFSNGLYSALPYLTFWALINAGGWLADFLSRKYFSLTVTRKILNTVGMIIPAMMLIGLGYVDCSSRVAAITLLVLAVGLTGFQYSGWLVNHVDIAPLYAGVLFGISNSIASVTGFISPVVVGVLTSKNQTRSEWQNVFYIAAGMYAFGAIFFLIFGSGEIQPWAKEEKSRENENLTEDKIEMNGVGPVHSEEAVPLQVQTV